MKYSASMVSCLFWFSETRKTAELIMQGKTLEEIKTLAANENIYQVRAYDRAKRIAGVSVKRLSVLSNELREKLVSCDLATAKLIVLISILKTDLLFYEFMHTVYKQAIILGGPVLSDSSVNVFFDNKIAQSEVVAGFSESAIKKLKQTYVKILIEAGMVESARYKKILIPMVDYRLQEEMKSAGLLPYLSTLTGEDYYE